MDKPGWISSKARLSAERSPSCDRIERCSSSHRKNGASPSRPALCHMECSQSGPRESLVLPFSYVAAPTPSSFRMRPACRNQSPNNPNCLSSCRTHSVRTSISGQAGPICRISDSARRASAPAICKYPPPAETLVSFSSSNCISSSSSSLRAPDSAIDCLSIPKFQYLSYSIGFCLPNCRNPSV